MTRAIAVAAIAGAAVLPAQAQPARASADSPTDPGDQADVNAAETRITAARSAALPQVGATT